MLNIIKKEKFLNNLCDTIVRNSLFDSNTIFRQRAKGINGIKICFRDETQGMLWVLNGKTYVFNYHAFDSIIKIPLSQTQGDEIWVKFMTTFEKKFTYQDV
jgi:hypothetical protein